jgi:hypothetical protein
MKWILIISWATNGTGFSITPPITKHSCLVAMAFVNDAELQRSRAHMKKACIHVETGEILRNKP